MIPAGINNLKNKDNLQIDLSNNYLTKNKVKKIIGQMNVTPQALNLKQNVIGNEGLQSISSLIQS